MKETGTHTLGIALTLLSAALMAACGAYGLFGAAVSVSEAALGVLAVFLTLALGTFFLVKNQNTQAERVRTVRRALLLLLLFYAVLLLGVLFVSRIRSVPFAERREEYRKTLEMRFNFIPGRTVRRYIRALRYNYIGVRIPLENLVGNLVLFMPTGVLLPALFRPMRTWWKYLLVMVFLLAAVEAVQWLLCCGTCDIDDFLLNLIGALAVFFVWRPIARRLAARLLPADGQACSDSAD